MTEIPEEWDFYLARINDQSASVFLNLGYRDQAPIDGYDTVLWVFLAMPDGDEHGMGTRSDGDLLVPLGDELVGAIEAALPTHYVARIRGEGKWQLYFYARNADAPLASAEALVRSHTSVPFEAGLHDDPTWACFREFLMPDEERWQWILDRRVVDRLMDYKDQLSVPREVDHWAFFATAEQRDAFIAAAMERGFMERGRLEQDRPRPFVAQIYRHDPTELEHIHSVAMELTHMAARLDGEYDGWESPVVKADE